MEKVLNVTTPKEKLMSTLTQPPPDIEELDAQAHPAPAVLPADHPLLAKFQRALKAHLLKVNAELQNEIDELDDGVAKLTRQQEQVGAELYDSLERIERQKDSLDDYNAQLQEIHLKRNEHESNAKTLQQKYDEENRAYMELKRGHNERLLELQHLQVLENNISKWAQEIEDEVQVAKRVVSKDGQNQMVVAQQKREVDMLLFNLDGEVKRSEHQLAAVMEQSAEQQLVLDSLNQSIHDANADVQALQNEHRRLIGSWNDAILCIKQRDKILAQQRETIFNEKQQQKVTDASIEGTRKSANKEMEQNEKLETFRGKLIMDLENMEQQVEKESNECRKLQRKIDTMNKVIEETEANQEKANVEGSIVENQLKTLRRSIEKLNEQKVKIEDQTLELLQDQITTDQASSHRGKVLRDVQEKRRHVELVMLQTEQQLSTAMVDLEKWKSMVTSDQQIIVKLTEDKNEATKRVNVMQQEITNMKNSINIKSKAYDAINRQLVQAIDAAGGMELDPNEMKLIKLEKKNADLDAQIRDAQAFWLQLQGHVVSLTEKRTEQFTSIHLTRKQLLVIEQKSLKIEAELETLKKQGKDTKRNLKNLYTKLDLLSAKFSENKRFHETEEFECLMSHQDLVNRLKDDEMAMLQLDAEIKTRQNEIAEAKEQTVERHREALSWETKWKMAAETIKYRANETAAASEIGVMRSEIHRMDVRLLQLRRAQEKLAQDMEHCVMHRDHIFDGASLRDKISDGGARTRYTIQHRLNDMKNKCKQAQHEMSALERDLHEATCNEQRYRIEIRMLQQMEEDERTQGQLLADEIGEKQMLRQENLDNIVRVQNRARQYRALLGAHKALPKCGSDTKLQADTERHMEVRQHLVEVLESLLQQYPNQKWPIKRALQTLKED